MSTPDAKSELGLFRGSNMPQRYDGLESARKRADEEVRSLKGRSLLVFAGFATKDLQDKRGAATRQR